MSTTRLHGDVLVLGSALEGAIAATLLAKRGWKVLWAGRPPAATATLGGETIQLAPGLMPALANAPGLTRALLETGVLPEVQRLLRPAGLQLLSAQRRLALPDDLPRLGDASRGFDSVREQVTELTTLSEEPLSIGFFGRRSFRGRMAAISARLAAPEGLAGEVTQALATLLGDTDGLLPALAIATAPHLLAGGEAALAALLHKRFLELGGTVLTAGLEGPISELRLGFGDVRCALAKGEALGARVLLLGLDDNERGRGLPAEELPAAARLEPKLLQADRRPLARLSYVLQPRGLPVALGPVAIVETAARRVLLERRALASGRHELALFWRRGDAPLAKEASEVAAALQWLAPFHEQHLVAKGEPALVAHHDRIDGERRVRPARRVLEGRGPLYGVEGAEGAGLAGAALAAQAMRLAPRKDLLA